MANLADFMTGRGFEQRADSETGAMSWYDPMSAESGGSPDQALSVFNIINAMNPQGQSVWGTEGAPMGTGAQWNSIGSGGRVSVGGKDFLRTGYGQTNYGEDLPYDPKYGYLQDFNQALEQNQYLKKTNPGSDWVDLLPMAIASYGAAAFAPAAAAGTAAHEVAHAGSIYNAGAAGAGAAGLSSGNSGFDMYPPAGVNEGVTAGAGTGGVYGGMEGMMPGFMEGAMNPFGAAYELYNPSMFSGATGGLSTAGGFGGATANAGAFTGAELTGSSGLGIDSLSDLWNMYRSASPYISGANSIFSGIQGLMQRSKMGDMASRYAGMANPYETSGTGALARGQLQGLLNDPAQAAAGDPSYKLAIQAAMRASAPYGQGSGRMATQAANASNSWLNNRLAALGPYTGAQYNPASGAQLMMNSNLAQNDMLSKSLASIAFGGSQLAGGGGDMASILNMLRMGGARV